MSESQGRGKKFRKKTRKTGWILLTCLCLAATLPIARSKAVTTFTSADVAQIAPTDGDDGMDWPSSTPALDRIDFSFSKKHGIGGNGSGAKKAMMQAEQQLEKRSGKHQHASRDAIDLKGSLSLSISDSRSTIGSTSTTTASTVADYSDSTTASSTSTSDSSSTATDDKTSSTESVGPSSSTTTTTTTSEMPEETTTETPVEESTTPSTATDDKTSSTGSVGPSTSTTAMTTTTTSEVPEETTTETQETDYPTTSEATTLPTDEQPTTTPGSTTTTTTSRSKKKTTPPPLLTTTSTTTMLPITTTATPATTTTTITTITTPASTLARSTETTSTTVVETSTPTTTTPGTTAAPTTTGESSTARNNNSTSIIRPTSATKEVTLLIRVVFKGTWSRVCSELQSIRQSLLNLVNNNVENNKKITLDQIVFRETRCSSNASKRSKREDASTALFFYVADRNGNLDENMTKMLPSLYKSAKEPFPLPIESFELEEAEESAADDSSVSIVAIVVASCVGFVCLILLIGLLFIMRKRQGRFNYGERCRPVSLDAYSLDSVSAYSSVRRSKLALRSSKRSYGNPSFEDSSAVPSHPLNFAGLTSFCQDLGGIAEEFSGIPQVTSKIDELPPGAELKNRYANVIPLPETRVTLQRLDNDPVTEYINASYVRGPKNASKYYIASQAPTEATVCDFWRMIWEQQVKVIVMLTDLVENGVEKCTEYIPPLEVSDCHRLYGDFQVTLRKREAKDKYAISSLQLKNLESNTFREVFHLWYLWPAKGVPSDPSGVISVLLEARALQRGATAPILMHCSPGTGRTGTAMALDLVIRQYEMTRTVDVPRVVYTIRRDRAGAVQTKEQYTFIYKAINQYASKLAGGGAVDS